MNPDQHHRAARAARDSYVTRPGVVTLICVTSFIVLGAQAALLLGFMASVPGYAWTEAIPTVLLGVLALGFSLTVVLGLWRARDWARKVYVVVFPLLAAAAALGEPNLLNLTRRAVLVPLCILLFQPQASAYFRGERLPAIDPASGLPVGDREVVRCTACDKELYATLSRCHHCGADPRPDGR